MPGHVILHSAPPTRERACLCYINAKLRSWPKRPGSFKTTRTQYVLYCSIILNTTLRAGPYVGPRVRS